MNPPARRSPARIAAAVCIIAAGFALIAVVLAVTVKGTNPAARDFIEYWATEQQLMHHGNPYDREAMLRTEQAAGFGNPRPEFWYSPPPGLIFAFPLGFVSASTGLVLWILFQFALLSGSLWIIWLLWGRPPTLLHLFGYLFAPALLCIQAGQISILLLMGVALFLYWHTSHPWLAGAALLPCILKPHLFLPFGIVLLLWLLGKRDFRLLGGFAAALAVGTGFTYSMDRNAWAAYLHMMRTDGMLDQYVATLSSAMRFAVDRNAAWLQFVPCAAACCWAVYYFWSRRQEWKWMEHGLFLLLVSAVCTPYGWFFDESVLLPAVLTGMYRAKQSGRSLLPIVAIGGAALMEVNASAGPMSHAYLWTTPAWLGWYVYATMPKKNASGEETGAERMATEPR